MFLASENCEFRVGSRYCFVRVGHLEVFLERDAERWPIGWFAKNDPGQPWERWGLGFHLICGFTKQWMAPERQG